MLENAGPLSLCRSLRSNMYVRMLSISPLEAKLRGAVRFVQEFWSTMYERVVGREAIGDVKLDLRSLAKATALMLLVTTSLYLLDHLVKFIGTAMGIESGCHCHCNETVTNQFNNSVFQVAGCNISSGIQEMEEKITDAKP